MFIETRVFGEYFLKISVHKNSSRICYKFLKKHSIKVDLNCLDPGNVHLNNLNAPVLIVLICQMYVEFPLHVFIFNFFNTAQKQRQPSRYSDYATGWSIRGANSCRRREILNSPETPDQPLGPKTSYSMENAGYFPEGKPTGV